MNNLVIIGNGFDLAHGLKTGYQHFVENIVDQKSRNSKLFNDLLYPKENFPTYQELKNLLYTSPLDFQNCFSNLFFRRICESHYENWCDIEKLYFSELIGNLMSYASNQPGRAPKNLNEKFENVKTSLENYLTAEQEKFSPTTSYKELFQHLNDASNTIVLNFNYTNTFSRYLDPTNNRIQSIHIHGELNSTINPIIFGFAANDIESRDLIAKDDNEYMRYIKKHCYKRSANENRLIKYLSKIGNLDVLILGHSCGISDKLILNQIFNHPNISSIRQFYHENHESYFQTQVNIARIMDDDANFKKLVNFSQSHRMPQYNDYQQQNDEFRNYIQQLLQAQKASKSSSVF